MLNISLGIAILAILRLAASESNNSNGLSLQAVTCFTKNSSNDKLYQYELTSKIGKKFTGTTFLVDQNDPTSQNFEIVDGEHRLEFEVYFDPSEFRSNRASVCKPARLVMKEGSGRVWWLDIASIAIGVIGLLTG